MDYTIQEINNHKNILFNLYNKLINTIDINEKISIVNEMKSETEFLSSLLNIKKNYTNQQSFINNDINIFNPNFNQNMNNFNNNNMNNDMMEQQMLQQQMMQQQMIQQQMMQQQMMQQQMMQQQMMQQQMIQQQQNFAQQNDINLNKSTEMIQQTENKEINITFRTGGSNTQVTMTKIKCSLNDRISRVIEKYRNKSGDNDSSKKFVFNARSLNNNSTVAQSGLADGSNIYVISTQSTVEEQKKCSIF